MARDDIEGVYLVARYFGSGRGLKPGVGRVAGDRDTVARYFGSGRGLKLLSKSLCTIDLLSPAISVVGVD